MSILLGILIGLHWSGIKIVLTVLILLIGVWLYPVAAALVATGLLSIQLLIVWIRRRSIKTILRHQR